jgi:hypothetical protein
VSLTSGPTCQIHLPSYSRAVRLPRTAPLGRCPALAQPRHCLPPLGRRAPSSVATSSAPARPPPAKLSRDPAYPRSAASIRQGTARERCGIRLLKCWDCSGLAAGRRVDFKSATVLLFEATRKASPRTLASGTAAAKRRCGSALGAPACHRLGKNGYWGKR